MKKSLLLVILAIVTVLASVFFVACKGEDGTSDSTEPTVSDSMGGSDGGSEILPEVTISLDKKDLTVDMYDEAELVANVKNSDEAVVWTSDNESIATVADGIVKGVAEGETTIKATVGGKTATCNVTVTKSSEIPVIRTEYSEMNLYSGDEFDFEVYAKWKNKKIEAVYDCMVKSGGDVVKMEKGTDGIFKVVALKAGTAEYTVSATAIGTTVYADVKFTVVNPVYSLKITNFTETESGFEYLLWRQPDGETSVTAEVIVTRAGKEIDYAELSWTSDDETIATAKDGVITGKKDGKTTVTVTVSGRGIEPFEKKIALTVKEEIYRKVTYYDSDKTTVLSEESVLDGTAAKYINKGYPEEFEIGDGYKGYYNKCEWVDEKGKSAAKSLEAVTSDMSVYAAYGYIAYKHYEFTEADNNKTVTNGAFATHNKYAKIVDGKLEMSFRAYADNTNVAFMELNNWSAPLSFECKKDVWYTFVIEFENDESGAHKYVGVKAYVLDEDGKVVKQATASDYDERLWVYAKMPYTPDSSGNPVYGTECKIDIGVPMSGVKSTYTVKYYDENGDELASEEVAEGETPKYVYEAEGEADKDLGNGYTLSYDGYKWVTEKGGKTEANLGSITDNAEVYLRKEYVAYISADKPSFKSLLQTNKYILAENGKLSFKVRITAGDVGATTFNLYEDTVWAAAYDESRIALWFNNIGLNKWVTITIDGNAKTYTVSDGNEIKTEALKFTAVNFDKISLVADKFTIDVAAVNPKFKPTFDVTYYDTDGTTVLYVEKVEEGDSAAYVPSKDLGNGYKTVYADYKWVTADGGTIEADLSNVSANVSVYLVGEKLIYKSIPYFNPDTEGYKNILATNEYIKAKDGKLIFKMNFSSEKWGSFVLCGKSPWSQLGDGSYNMVQPGVDTSECGKWWTIEADLSTYVVTVKKPDGSVAVTKTLNPFEANDLTFYLCDLSGVDLAAVA